MAVTYSDWAGTTVSYTSGQKVKDDGVVYAANKAIASNANNTRPCEAPDDWDPVAVLRIQSYSSLIEAIRLELNTTDDRINDSVPLYIQMAEASFRTRIRAPIQRCETVLTVDAESKVSIPSDLLQVINLRINDDDAGGDSIISRGGTEILAGNYEEYKDLQRFYKSSNGFVNRRAAPTNYDAPVYWFDSSSFYIAPDLDEGTELELYYYATIPDLGSTVFIVDGDGSALNGAGQTLAEWVAAGNDADDFVQASEEVSVNWFIQAAPQMLLYGALVSATSYLHNDERAPMWHQRFQAAELETMELIDRFEEGRHHTQQIYNAYSQ